MKIHEIMQTQSMQTFKGVQMIILKNVWGTQ